MKFIIMGNCNVSYIHVYIWMSSWYIFMKSNWRIKTLLLVGSKLFSTIFFHLQRAILLSVSITTRKNIFLHNYSNVQDKLAGPTCWDLYIFVTVPIVLGCDLYLWPTFWNCMNPKTCKSTLHATIVRICIKIDDIPKRNNFRTLTKNFNGWNNGWPLIHQLQSDRYVNLPSLDIFFKFTGPLGKFILKVLTWS